MRNYSWLCPDSIAILYNIEIFLEIYEYSIEKPYEAC
jgi:hypothetical protein